MRALGCDEVSLACYPQSLTDLEVQRLPALAPPVLLFSLDSVRDQPGAAERRISAPEAASAAPAAHPRPSRRHCPLPAAVGPGAWTHAGSPCPCLSSVPRFTLTNSHPAASASSPRVSRPGARTRVGRLVSAGRAADARPTSLSSRFPLNSPKAKQIAVMASPEVGHPVCSYDTSDVRD